MSAPRLTFGDQRLCERCHGSGLRSGVLCAFCGGAGIDGLSRAQATELGRAKRDAILVRVAGSDAEWAAKAAGYFEQLAPGRICRAEDLRDAIGSPSTEPQMGAAFRAAASAGLIVRIGVVASSIPSSHARSIGKWRRV